jgi:beta-galactosidase/beta-glucuronidase
MSVPAIWDDQVERLRATPFWVSARFNPNYRRLEFPMGDGSRGLPDASLPYLLGVGWYRTALRLPRDWKPGLVTLQVGGVRLEAWVWLNGVFIGNHLGHSTPFQMRLDEALQSGGPNVLTIAVANTRAAPKGAEHWYLGSDVQGYQGRSGGIYRPVSLYVTGPARIASWLA